MEEMLINEHMKEWIHNQPHALVGYLTAGYPTCDDFFRIVPKCYSCGLSILEVGFPSENPYEDGEVIRKAHLAVDKNIRTDIGFWKKLREIFPNPIWIMGYQEDLFDTGFYRVLAEDGLVDAFVIPGLSFDKTLNMKQKLIPFGVDVIGFISASMSREEVDRILDNFGVIYQQLYSGMTGVANESDSYKKLLHYCKGNGHSVLFAGFGIQSAERVDELIHNGFYGTIIGTALMKALNRSEDELYAFMKKLSEPVKRLQKNR